MNRGGPGVGNDLRAAVLIGEAGIALAGLLALLAWWPRGWWAWAVAVPVLAAWRAGIPLSGLAGPFRLRRALVVAAGLAAVTLPLLTGAALIRGGWRPPQWPTPAALAGLAGAAAAEEWFFRGWMQLRLASRWPRGGVILAAAAFALAHLPAVGPVGLLAFLPGVLLGAARSWSGAVFAPVLLHFVWNLWASGLAGWSA